MTDARNAEGYADPTPRPQMEEATRQARRKLSMFIKCVLSLANAMGIQVTSDIGCRDRETGVEWRRVG